MPRYHHHQKSFISDLSPTVGTTEQLNTIHTEIHELTFHLMACFHYYCYFLELRTGLRQTSGRQTDLLKPFREKP